MFLNSKASPFSRLFLVSLMSIAVIGTGCSKNGFKFKYGRKDSIAPTRKDIEPRPEVKAPKTIAESFAVEVLVASVTASENSFDSRAEAPSQLSADRSRIKIKKTALEKEFLLMGSLIPQSPIPSFGGLKSRVVAFRLIENKLYLLEATQGHRITNELPQNLILTSFPILAEDETEITFDFNSGMAQIFVAGDWYAQDLDSPRYKYDLSLAEVRHSFIDQAYLSNSNALVIRQIAQVKMGAAMIAPIEARFYLKPYQPDETYKPVTSHGFTTFGFFETAPMIQADGSSIVRATKFHSAKPITFAISANTPADFKQAVRDGILYWNKAFGSDVIRVVELEDKSITAPHPDYNIVQWVNWDTAGFAFADAQMDPRSGEILHAQVFMTSAFAAGGKLQAEQLLRKLSGADFSEMNKANGHQHPRARHLVSLMGMEQTPLCDFELHDSFRHSLESVVLSNQSDATILKLSQDYVREVVAHEIGHTLGLRHNFAGSLAANYSLNERAKLFESYMKNLKAPEGLVTSSSVMEYQLFEEGAMNGDQISRSETSAAEYDQKVIAALYKEQKFERSEVPPFCTDSHRLLSYLDCRIFDTGASPVELAAFTYQNEIEQLPYQLLSAYIAAKTPTTIGSEPTRVEDVPLSVISSAVGMMDSRYGLIQALTGKGQIFKVRRTFPEGSDIWKTKIDEAEVSYLQTEIERLGGYTNVLPMIDNQFAQKLSARFAKLLDSPEYSAGRRAGKDFSFSSEEKEVMRRNAELFFAQLQEELIRQDLKAVGGGLSLIQESMVQAGQKIEAGKLRDHDLSFEFIAPLNSRIESYLFATTGDKTVVEIQVPGEGEQTKAVTVYLPKFKYPYDIRLLAAGLLKSDRALAPEWGAAERGLFSERLADEMKAVLTVEPEKLKAERLPRPAARWLLENQKILKQLSE